MKLSQLKKHRRWTAIALGLLVSGATTMVACGDSGDSKSGTKGEDANNSSPSNSGGDNSGDNGNGGDGETQTCTTDAECGAGATCATGQGLATRQQALCDEDETEVCTDDFGAACVPDGEDDPFCFCDCTPNFDDGGEPGNDDSSNNDTPDTPQPSGRCIASDEGGSNNTPDPPPDNDPDNGGGDDALCVEFSTGSNAFVGEDVYTTCDGFPPQNCRTGGFIWFNGDQSECICALRCEDFDPVRQPGEACDTNGDFVCQYVENASGTSKGNWCIPTSWDDDLDCSQ